MNPSPSCSSKGQVSLEVVIVVAVVLLITAALLVDIVPAFSKNTVPAVARNVAWGIISSNTLSADTCIGAYVRNMSVVGKEIPMGVVCCAVAASQIADGTETEACNVAPNGNDMIDCADSYKVVVS